MSAQLFCIPPGESKTDVPPRLRVDCDLVRADDDAPRGGRRLADTLVTRSRCEVDRTPPAPPALVVRWFVRDEPGDDASGGGSRLASGAGPSKRSCPEVPCGFDSSTRAFSGLVDTTWPVLLRCLGPCRRMELVRRVPEVDSTPPPTDAAGDPARC